MVYIPFRILMYTYPFSATISTSLYYNLIFPEIIDICNFIHSNYIHIYNGTFHFTLMVIVFIIVEGRQFYSDPLIYYHQPIRLTYDNFRFSERFNCTHINFNPSITLSSLRFPVRFNAFRFAFDTVQCIQGLFSSPVVTQPSVAATSLLVLRLQCPSKS